jgi:hypothetical protein
MKSNYLMNRIAMAIFAFSLLFGIGIASSITAHAQYQNDQWRRDRAYEREQRRREREAIREQRRRNRGESVYDRDNGYGNDYGRDRGYGNDYGRNRGRDADGYGNYGGSFDLRQTALNAGFADGVKEGRNDRSRNERRDFTDESNFQKGTRDYSSRLGDRSIYQRYYREAFSHGYADGYGGY